MKIRFAYLAALAVAVALAFGACSGSSTSPSSVSGAATLQGTVNASSTSSAMSARSVHALSAPAAGITVTIMETGATTTTDASGRFTLTNVPAGTVTLHFQASGIDATLTISGIVAGQTLTIKVTVSGSNASLDQEQPEATPSPGASPSPEPSPGASCFQAGEHAEVEGHITAVAADSITVDQEGHGLFQCMVSASTEIRHGNKHFVLADLHVGDHVHVSGTGLGSSGGVCQVQATEIKLQ